VEEEEENSDRGPPDREKLLKLEPEVRKLRGEFEIMVTISFELSGDCVELELELKHRLGRVTGLNFELEGVCKTRA